MALMASNLKFDLRIENGNLNYPGILMHVTSKSHFGERPLWPSNDPEVKSDLRIELSDLNCLCFHTSLACKGFPEMIETTNGDNYDPLTSHHYRPLVKTIGTFQ